MKNADNTNAASSTATRSTSTPPGLRSGAGWIVSQGHDVREEFLDALSEGELLALPYVFEFWAMEHQLPPEGDWRTWVILGGRGAGKTRAGAEWVRAQVEGAKPLDAGRCRRLALVGETVEQVREVMVFGESGIMACSPPDRRPEWQATRKRLVWLNGAIAQVFSAHEPDGLRGPQFDGAWVDELAKWKKARNTWEMLQFGLRLGDAPQVCVTTTPRNVGVLKDILASDSTLVTNAPTEAKIANLAQGFLEEVRARYAGTRLGRQELEGVLMEAAEDALWTPKMLETARVESAPALDRIVVVGAITQGPVQDWKAWVLADESLSATGPAGWARGAIRAKERWGADRLVAEVNQGGDLVEQVIRQVDPLVPFRKVHASRGKITRAEPVAALYEQGRVHHLRGLGALEDQMCAMTVRGYEGRGSPDRVDALVWALTDLIVEPGATWRRPRVRAV